MDAEELKRIQAPLKAHYKEDPSSALVTLRAAGHVVQETVTFVLDTGKPGVPAGLHPAAGGDGSAACSGDMLLEALVACAGVTLAAVATAMGIELNRATVSAEGDLDFRGTLAASREAPVGFSQIRLLFSIETATPADKVQKLVELSERYCVILQTLSHPPKIETRTSHQDLGLAPT
ncbi:MAG TPA: OsmC family protein [Polyangiaceae bacterium]